MNRLQAEALGTARKLRTAMYETYNVSNVRELARLMAGANAMSLALLDLIQALDNIDEQEHLPDLSDRRVPTIELAPEQQGFEPEPEYVEPVVVSGPRYSEDNPPFGVSKLELHILRVLAGTNGGSVNSKQLYSALNWRRKIKYSTRAIWEKVVSLENSGQFLTTRATGKRKTVHITNKGAALLRQIEATLKGR